jgi:outer membrane lipoprotein SlyB
MKNILIKNTLTIIGVIAGAIAGFFYWKFIGCTSGTCYIQSNPFRMTLYGALMGGLIFNMIQPKPKQQHGKEN